LAATFIDHASPFSRRRSVIVAPSISRGRDEADFGPPDPFAVPGLIEQGRVRGYHVIGFPVARRLHAHVPRERRIGHAQAEIGESPRLAQIENPAAAHRGGFASLLLFAPHVADRDLEGREALSLARPVQKVGNLAPGFVHEPEVAAEGSGLRRKLRRQDDRGQGGALRGHHGAPILPGRSFGIDCGGLGEQQGRQGEEHVHWFFRKTNRW
jgi:hypothetical protein